MRNPIHFWNMPLFTPHTGLPMQRHCSKRWGIPIPQCRRRRCFCWTSRRGRQTRSATRQSSTDLVPKIRSCGKRPARILVRHPEWAGHAVGFLRDLLVKPVQSQEDRAAFADLVLAFLANDQVQELVAAAIRNDGGKFPAERRVQVLELISHSTLAEIPRVWVDSLAQAVDQAPPEVRLAAVRCAAVLQISELDDRLDRLANSPDEPVELRREALRAIVPRRMTLRPETFDLLMDDLSSEADPLLRLAAAEVFGKTQLDGEQLLALLHTIQADALITPAVLLPMLERSTTPKTEPVVLGYLEESIRGGWRPPRDALKRLLASLSNRLARVLNQFFRQRREVWRTCKHASPSFCHFSRAGTPSADGPFSFPARSPAPRAIAWEPAAGRSART